MLVAIFGLSQAACASVIASAIAPPNCAEFQQANGWNGGDCMGRCMACGAREWGPCRAACPIAGGAMGENAGFAKWAGVRDVAVFNHLKNLDHLNHGGIEPVDLSHLFGTEPKRRRPFDRAQHREREP